MLSRQYIREHADEVREALRKRHEDAPLDEILQLDSEHRAILKEAEELKARRNAVSQQIGKLKEKPAELIAEMRTVGDRIRDLDGRGGEIEARLNDLLLYVPNIPHPDVPEGASDADNVEIRRWGETGRLAHGGALDFEPLPHWEIAEKLGIADFERGSKVSGSRFYILKGLGARLERALINFMLDLHTSEHGYTEVWPTYAVKSASMQGTGQLPKFAEDAYRLEGEDLWLIPTAEVPVTNLHRDEILEPGTLPLNYVAFSPCFRSEAGAAGRDTRGMVRVHQFSKVEMVKFVEPATSWDELRRLLGQAESVLQRLNLPYRVVQMCTADVGFTAAMKFDPEAWFPGLQRFVEISSCSNFTDFQARRANIRYRPAPGARPEFVHTLNGSGLAVGRTMACLIENYQQQDGTVVVPEAIRPYMGGVGVIG